MSIVYYPTSRRQNQAFQDDLSRLVQLRRIPANLPVLPNTFQVFNIKARDVLMHSDPGVAAKLLSYRYFAGGNSPETTVAGDVDVLSTSRVTAWSYGAGVQASLRAADRLNEHPDFKGATPYEPRLLRIPGVYVEAFWLKPLSAGGDPDWIVPYHTLIKELDPEKAYKIKEFYNTLRPYAERVLTQNDLPKAVPKRLPPQEGLVR